MSAEQVFPAVEWSAWRLDGGGVTVVVAGPQGRIPGIVYWGASLSAQDDLVALARATQMPVMRGGLDTPWCPSLFPEAGHAHIGAPALEGFALEGGVANRWITQFALAGADAQPARLTLAAHDRASQLALEITLSLETGTGVLRASNKLTNTGASPFVVNALAAPALPLPHDDAALLTWHGRWCAEFQREAQPWGRGARVIESRTGRTGHEGFPGLVSLAAGAGETAGRATGLHLAHSGNWRIVAQDFAPGARLALAGALYLPGEIVLAPGASLATPTLFAAVSNNGLGAFSKMFHGEARGHVIKHPRPGAPRPVHFNSWEAVYFDLSVPVLQDLATRAAAVGAERFVVDDGWFPGRSHDRAGLGDWVIDAKKFPDGFKPLISHVHSLGMDFGLWVEPEMVNADSDLYRAHPDWALHVDGLAPIEGRQQRVLDIARPDVSDCLFSALDSVLRDNAIAYLKWDMNRVLTHPGRAGSPVAQQQTAALYALLARLRKAHPGVEIESCSSGGGRIDFGILAHTDRFWLSDNNDAHDRVAMNREASVFFPPEVFGHHVGPARCHTSGRLLSMQFRAFSAAVSGGHMGMELDLRALGPEDEDTLKSAIRFHKKWRSLLHTGRLHRLAGEAHIDARMTVAANGGRFLAGFIQTRTQPDAAPAIARLAGLEPQARYRLRFAQGAPVPLEGARSFASPLLEPGGFAASGQALMTSGFRLPSGWPDMIFVVEGEMVS